MRSVSAVCPVDMQVGFSYGFSASLLVGLCELHMHVQSSTSCRTNDTPGTSILPSMVDRCKQTVLDRCIHMYACTYVCGLASKRDCMKQMHGDNYLILQRPLTEFEACSWRAHESSQQLRLRRRCPADSLAQ